MCEYTKRRVSFRMMKQHKFTVVISCVLIIMCSIMFAIFSNTSAVPRNEMFAGMDEGLHNDIPKIIHQIAPNDPSEWTPEVITYRASWKQLPKFRYKLWSREEISALIKDSYPSFDELYHVYVNDVNKRDMAIYIILYEYGGVYVDLNYEFKQNFYDTLHQETVNIAVSTNSYQPYVNKFIASPRKHPFWISIFNALFDNSNDPNVVSATGHRLLDAVVQSNPSMVTPLNVEEYNTPGLYVTNHNVE